MDGITITIEEYRRFIEDGQTLRLIAKLAANYDSDAALALARDVRNEEAEDA